MRNLIKRPTGAAEGRGKLFSINLQVLAAVMPQSSTL